MATVVPRQPSQLGRALLFGAQNFANQAARNQQLAIMEEERKHDRDRQKTIDARNERLVNAQIFRMEREAETEQQRLQLAAITKQLQFRKDQATAQFEMLDNVDKTQGKNLPASSLSELHISRDAARLMMHDPTLDENVARQMSIQANNLTKIGRMREDLLKTSQRVGEVLKDIGLQESSTAQVFEVDETVKNMAQRLFELKQSGDAKGWDVSPAQADEFMTQVKLFGAAQRFASKDEGDIIDVLRDEKLEIPKDVNDFMEQIDRFRIGSKVGGEKVTEKLVADYTELFADVARPKSREEAKAALARLVSLHGKDSPQVNYFVQAFIDPQTGELKDTTPAPVFPSMIDPLESVLQAAQISKPKSNLEILADKVR